MEVAFWHPAVAHDVVVVAILDIRSGAEDAAIAGLPEAGVADAIVVAKLMGKCVAADRVLHPQVAPTGQACVGHTAAGKAQAAKQHAHDVIGAQTAAVAVAGVAYRTDVDGRVTAAAGVAEGVSRIAEQFAVPAGTAIHIVGGGLRHAVEVLARARDDPRLAVGHVADLIRNHTIQHIRRRGLRVGKAGEVAEVHPDQKDVLGILRPRVRLHLFGGLSTRKIKTTAAAIGGLGLIQHIGAGIRPRKIVELRKSLVELRELRLVREVIQATTSKGHHRSHRERFTAEEALRGILLPHREEPLRRGDFRRVELSQGQVMHRRRAIERDALHRDRVLAHHSRATPKREGFEAAILQIERGNVVRHARRSAAHRIILIRRRRAEGLLHHPAKLLRHPFILVQLQRLLQRLLRVLPNQPRHPSPTLRQHRPTFRQHRCPLRLIGRLENPKPSPKRFFSL